MYTQDNISAGDAVTSHRTTLPSYAERIAAESEYARKRAEREQAEHVAYLEARYFAGLDDDKAAKEEATNLLHLLKPMNRRFAVAVIEGKTVVLDMFSIEPPEEDRTNVAVQAATVERAFPTAMEFASLEKLFKDSAVWVHQGKTAKLMNLASIWLEWPHRRVYARGLIFAPGVAAEALPERLNLFTGWGIESDSSSNMKADEEACSEYLRHLRDVVCGGDERIFDWLMWWQADIRQHPQRKPGSAIVLAGKKGSGKSTVAEVLRKVLGQKYFVRLSKKNDLVGNHNEHLACALLINCEEVTFGGDVATNDTLKDLITSPTILINPKFVGAHTMPSVARFVFTTNSHYSHSTSEDERRFLFLDVSDEYVGDLSYWSRLYGQLEAGGYEAFARILDRMQKPEGVDLRKPPRTRAHDRLFAESLSVEERFFLNALATGEGYPAVASDAGGIVYLSDVKSDFDFYLEEHGKDRSLKKSDNNFVPAMMRRFWGAESEGRRMRERRKEACYRVPSLQDAREVASMKIEDGGPLGLSREAVGLDEED